MARAMIRLLSVEMAVLGLIELILSFTLIFFMLNAGSPGLTRDYAGFAAILALTIATTGATIGLYRTEHCLNYRRLALTAVIATLLAFPAMLLVDGVWHMTLSGDRAVWLARILLFWLAFLLLARGLVNRLARALPMARPVLILGDGPRVARLRRRLANRRHWPFEPMAPDSTLDAATPLAGGKRVWGVVIAGGETAAAGAALLPPETRKALLDHKLRGMPIYSDVSFQEHHLGRIELESVDADWLLRAEGFRDGPVSRAIKRCADIAVSLLLLVMTLPLMLVTALLIKFDSKGPLFYRQVRSGLHGQPYTLFKFRSMTADAEAPGQAQWACESDPRVTRVGGFIRASRIDELPQLLNVLRGEMSMIGPRPERPVFVRQLSEAIPLYDHRTCVKPGLTGWAQVNFPYGASVEDAREKLAYDLYYVKNRGVLLDLVILLSTVRVIVFREGAR